MNVFSLHGVAEALKVGCRIESFDGASVRIVSPRGAIVGAGAHAHVEDSLTHAVALFAAGNGRPVEKGDDHGECGRRCGPGTHEGKCHMAGLHEYGQLGAWMHPAVPAANASDREFRVERDGDQIRVVLRLVYLGPCNGRPARIKTTRTAIGLDFPSALAAALVMSERTESFAYVDGRPAEDED